MDISECQDVGMASRAMMVVSGKRDEPGMPNQLPVERIVGVLMYFVL